MNSTMWSTVEDGDGEFVAQVGPDVFDRVSRRVWRQGEKCDVVHSAFEPCQPAPSSTIGMCPWNDGFDFGFIHRLRIGKGHDEGGGSGVADRRLQICKPICSEYHVARAGGFRAWPKHG